MLYSTVGCHPTRCTEFDEHKQGPEDYLKQLSKIISENRKHVVAIGECGLGNKFICKPYRIKLFLSSN